LAAEAEAQARTLLIEKLKITGSVQILSHI
jgi:hypothetical protein